MPNLLLFDFSPITIAIYQCTKQTWFDPTGGKAELCGYCLDTTVTLGKLVFLCNPRDGKATKGKQIGLEGKGMVVVNPLLKVATLVSSAVPYSESWSLYTSFLACPGSGSKPEFEQSCIHEIDWNRFLAVK